MTHITCIHPIDITRGVGPLLDFLPVPDPTALAASAVALANTDGGAVVIGLDSDGVYAGPIDGSAVAQARRSTANLCSPSIMLDCYELVATPRGPVIAIHVTRGTRVHAMRDGQVLVRDGKKNRALNGDEIRQLLADRANGDFEADVIPGASPSDLDPQWVSDFLVRGTFQNSPFAGCEPDDLLRYFGAITPEGGVTVAGMLLFGQEPQHWLPQSTVRFMRYVDRGGAQIAIDRTLTGPTVRLIDELWYLIREQMRTPATIGEQTSFDYAPEAVREALINAVCHRDYRLRDRHITVSMLPDRLEVASPGGLPGFMTKKSMLTGRYSRNPRLARCLAQWGYGSAGGSGMMTIILSMDGYSPHPPQIVDAPYSVTVRLHNKHEVARESVPASTTDLNNRQRTALDYARDNGSITMREFRTLFPAHSPADLQSDLSTLANHGHLRKIGTRTRAYYILP